MKVLFICGSPHKHGNTRVAVDEMISVFKGYDVETEVVYVGGKEVRGCMGCGSCVNLGKCVINDDVNVLAEKFSQADGLVLASPVYYASANGALIACLDRLFYSAGFDTRMKVGASIVVARRGGCSATFDQLNKYFSISGMPIAPSQYWNLIHGAAAGEAAYDGEGLQTMRTLAHNMVFMMRGIALSKEKYGLPAVEERIATNFIR